MPRRFANSNARTRVSKDEDGRLPSPSCFETRRSAFGLRKRLRSRRAAMLLSMRARGTQRTWAAEAPALASRCDAPQHEGEGRRTNLRVYEIAAGAISLFPVVIYNDFCNSRVSGAPSPNVSPPNVTPHMSPAMWHHASLPQSSSRLSPSDVIMCFAFEAPMPTRCLHITTANPPPGPRPR